MILLKTKITMWSLRKMNNYFNEGNAVKFDLQNGKIETICFCRDEDMAKEIAIALNKHDNEDDE